MSSSESAYEGKFTFERVPYFKWLLERYADPRVKKVVCQKSAQIGWTQSVICNLIGHFIDIERPTCIVLLPSGPAVKKFNEEKFTPLLESNPKLAKIVPVKSKDRDAKIDWKKLPGGYIKFVGSNTPDGVKSSTGSRLIVEEPDDCNLNLKGQGDAIKLLEERGKTVPDVKILIGGTPTVKGLSSIVEEFEYSDQNYWYVPCPDCGEYQPLVWEQVKWLKDEEKHDAIYGHHKPETAHYICTHCNSAWTDELKNDAVVRGEARAMQPFRGIVGLALNELYATMQGSRMEELVKKYLLAVKEFKQGNPDALVPFYNATLGLPYEHKTDLPAEDELRERCEDYPENFVPEGGLILTAGVDVQRDRFAIIIRAWGRGEESWLLTFTEIYGTTTDLRDPVYKELAHILFRPYESAIGREMRISRFSIDSGDGITTDQVYSFVRRYQSQGALAVKGMAESDREIYALPQKKDTNYKATKAAKYGLRVYIVGTDKAKDLIVEGRLKLKGRGPGVMHWPKCVRADYFKQLLGEVKAPFRFKGKIRRVWTQKKGQAVEALDAEVYCLHAARSVKTNMLNESYWQGLEAQLRQMPLFVTEKPKENVTIDEETGEILELSAEEDLQADIAQEIEPENQQTSSNSDEKDEVINKFTGRSSWLRR